MNKMILKGGVPLIGETYISGSKNSALPIIFSCILIKGVSKIDNLPDIGDVRVALKILKDMGAWVTVEEKCAYIDSRNMEYKKPDGDLVSSIRASTYLIGACLSRFGKCHIMPFGGCRFSDRPIDMHIDAAISFGGIINNDEITTDNIVSNSIIFNKPSVGATVNAILLAATAKGDSVIRGCAIEPHIDSLICFLNSAGANIRRIERDIYISGRELHGGNICIDGDMIEAGSYLGAALITGGELCLRGCPTEHMTKVFDAFKSLGAHITFEDKKVILKKKEKSKYLSLIATPYPGFPTDLQPIFAPIMARFSGGDITDTVWHGRFGYLKCLSSFGISSFLEKEKAYVYRSEIHSAVTTSPDLRGGAACILAALCASGESIINSADIILRGYESIEKKLCALGAYILLK